MEENKIKSPIKKESKGKKNHIRCSFCKKKCNLIHFKCKCNGLFCSIHRYTHMHNCNYKEKNAEEKKKEIKENNPKLEKDKVDKI